MDSLLANYASSDEEEDQQRPIQAAPTKTTPSSSLLSSLPQPKSSPSSLFQSLPQPKSSSSLFQSLPKPKQSSINPSPTLEDADEASATSSKSSDSDSLFSSLPKPKSEIQQPQAQPKKVVQFKPPIIHLPKPTQLHDDDDEDDEEEERKRRRKLQSSTQTPSVKSFLSSIPAPRNTATLGVQSSSGLGRRSIIETEAAPEPAPESNPSACEGNAPVDQNAEDYVNNENYNGYQYYGADQNAGSGSGYLMGDANYVSGTDQTVGFQTETRVSGSVGYGDSDGAYASYGAYGDYGQYANNWIDRSAAEPEASGVGDGAVRIHGKRGRNEIPTEIIEVKQDELIKNRPREDQVKVTGIAFGPAYQPVSAKGKPTKLHKRKHQIGSLYFDMKQNEMKLAERRAKGMLTKAETQAKYGW